PSANISRDCAVPARSGSCSTTMRPAAESATNRSPEGATASQRGSAKPLANTDTTKPGGTRGEKPAGGGPILGGLLGDAEGAGSETGRPPVSWACAGEDADASASADATRPATASPAAAIGLRRPRIGAPSGIRRASRADSSLHLAK